MTLSVQQVRLNSYNTIQAKQQPSFTSSYVEPLRHQAAMSRANTKLCLGGSIAVAGLVDFFMFLTHNLPHTNINWLNNTIYGASILFGGAALRYGIPMFFKGIADHVTWGKNLYKIE